MLERDTLLLRAIGDRLTEEERQRKREFKLMVMLGPPLYLILVVAQYSLLWCFVKWIISR